MTSSSRRKHRITPRALAWTTISVALLVGGFAWAEEDLEVFDMPRIEPLMADPVLLAPPTLPTLAFQDTDPPRMIPDVDDEQLAYSKVDTEPPPRSILFNLRSENGVLEAMRQEFKLRLADQAFIIPGAIDRFDNPNSENLGLRWRQVFRSGPSGLDQERLGEMGIMNKMGQFPYQLKPDVEVAPELAVMTESVGSENMFVTVYIELGDPENEFGIALRAQDPEAASREQEHPELINTLRRNKFYYGVMTADQLTIGKFIPDPKDPAQSMPIPLKRVLVPPKTEFTLGMTAFGSTIAVYRDGVELLRIEDSEITGRFAGLVGVRVANKPVRFDDFCAGGYGGQFADRMFQPTVSAFRGPNVHYGPLYFEQRSVERYGQHMGNLVQPLLSNGFFFMDLVFLPYSVASNPPWTCDSGEGLPLPGDIVLPFQMPLPRPDKHGFTLQTAALALAFALIP